MTAAVELPRDPAAGMDGHAAGRVVELASGLLMLLDAHRITGRLPLHSRLSVEDRFCGAPDARITRIR